VGANGEMTPAPENVGRKLFRPQLIGMPRVASALKVAGMDVAADDGLGTLPNPMDLGVRATVRFHEAMSEPVIGMLIRTQIGFEVYGTNTELERVTIGPRKEGDTVTVVFQFLCDLCPQPYTLTLVAHDPDGTAHDWLDDAVAITVADERGTPGVANLRAKVSVEEEVKQSEL